MKRAHVLVSGKVQGVFYRDAARQEAERHSVTGWIRNLPDGRVEAVFEGEDDPVDAMLAWCHDGSPRAQVTGVEVALDDAKGEFDRFQVTS